MEPFDPVWADKDKFGWQHEIVAPGETFPDLYDAPILCVDLETRPRPGCEKLEMAAVHPWRNEIFGLVLAVPGYSWYFPLRHRAPGSEAFNLDPAQVFAYLQDVLNARPTRTLVNHFLKFDLETLATSGVTVPRETDLFCTWVGMQLVDERHKVQKLKTLTAVLLNMPAAEEKIKDSYLRSAKFKKGYEDWSVVPADVMGLYACSDGERAIRLAAFEQQRLIAEDLQAVWDVERKLTRTLFDGEMRGIRVDLNRLIVDYKELLEQAIGLEGRIERLAGVSFNPSSPEEIADVVANLMGIPILHRTRPTDAHPYGQPRFDDDALQEYMLKYPERAEVFWNVRKVRRIYHLRSFIESYLFYQVDGVIHPKFNQNDAVTGRMTASDPNMQQVMQEESWSWQTPDGDVLETWTAPGARRYFVPREGMALVLSDYSQIEYRLFAHYTQSARLVQAYRENPDIDFHQWTADVILKPFGIKRRAAKNMNFGFIYGMGKSKLIASLNTPGNPVSEAEGVKAWEHYHAEVPEVKPLIEEVSRKLRKRGFVRTVLGRRRRASADLNARRDQPRTDRGLLPYQALNAVCQGSGADVLKDCMNHIADHLWHNLGSGHVLVPIHDEVITEHPREIAEQMARQLKPVYETFQTSDFLDRIRVPIYVSQKITYTNWHEAKELAPKEKKP